MVDWFVGFPASKIWLDWHMAGLSVDLWEILIQDLGVASNYGANNMRIALERLLIGDQRPMNEPNFGRHMVVLFGSG